MTLQTPRMPFPGAAADVCDLLGDDALVLGLPWLSFGKRRQIHGRVATVRTDNDSALIRSVLEQEGDGRVLVIDNSGSRERAVFGDRFGTLVLDNGWTGVVINGALRDSTALADMDVGVFALGTCPRRPFKRGLGQADTELTIAGANIRPGDWLVADADGVVIVTTHHF